MGHSQGWARVAVMRGRNRSQLCVGVCVVAVICATIAAPPVAVSENDSEGGRAEETTTAPGVPRDILRIMDKVFRGQVQVGNSQWERAPAGRRDWNGRVRKPYDIDEPLQKTQSLIEASKLFAIRKDFVAVAEDQLVRFGMKWEDLALAQRHRVLDYLLALNSGPGATGGDIQPLRMDLIGRLLEADGGAKEPTVREGVRTFREMLKLSRYIRRHTALVKKKDKAGRRDEFFMGRVIRLGDESVVCVGLRLQTVSFYLPDRVRVLKTYERGSNYPVPNIQDDRPWAVHPVLWDAAAVPGEPVVVFAIGRFDTVFTTQLPSALLVLAGGKWLRIATPPGPVLSCVAVAPDGKFPAVGNVGGEVLMRRGKNGWMKEQVFRDEGVAALFGKDDSLVAVSEHGAIAVRRDERWAGVQERAEGRVQQSAMLEDGSVILLYSDGRLEKSGREGRSDIDYRAVIPEEDRLEFSLRGLSVWADSPCVWGLSGRNILVVDTNSKQTLRLPILPERSYSLLERLGPTPLDTDAVGPVFAWSDGELVYHDGEDMFLVDRDGARSVWEGHVARSASSMLPGYASKDQIEAVRAALSRGADVETVDFLGDTALHNAADAGHESIVRLLLANGAKVDARDASGETALHLAAWRDHHRVAQLLLASGAQTDATEERYGLTPLHCAAWRGHEATVDVLLANGASAHAKDEYGRTPLRLARRGRHSKVADTLRDHMKGDRSRRSGTSVPPQARGDLPPPQQAQQAPETEGSSAENEGQ